MGEMSGARDVQQIKHLRGDEICNDDPPDSSEVARKDFGAFVERFVMLPLQQPRWKRLDSFAYALSDMMDVEGHVGTFGSPDWKTTHEPAKKNAEIVAYFRREGATCVGRTVTGELGFGITGENAHYGTPVNPRFPEFVPGGSASGSAVAVASGIVHFALGIDIIGDVRIPASFCGVLGFRPSHGVISMVRVIPVSASLDTVGFFTRNVYTMHTITRPLMQDDPMEPGCSRRLIFADDLFQLSEVPKDKTTSIIARVVESRPGYSPPAHMNFGQHIASNVPSLRSFYEKSANLQNGMTPLRALSSIMVLLQRYEWKTNHEEWVKAEKPNISPEVSEHILANSLTYDDIQLLHKVRIELRTAIHTLLKDGGILVFPTVSHPPPKVNVERKHSVESYDRTLILCSIASISGCCQVTVPLVEHDGCPISVSFMCFHGADRFLLDAVLLDIYPALQRACNLASKSVVFPAVSASLEVAELLNEMGNAACGGRQFLRAIKHYSHAIQFDGARPNYYCNRAAAFMEFACFLDVESDCSSSINLGGEKNVKAYLMRGKAQEMLLEYEDALQDFKHALVLEPENKIAVIAVERLRKRLSR